MSWGCKPENKPNGCGWAQREVWRDGFEEWWCETCERSGSIDPSPKPERSTAGNDA